MVIEADADAEALAKEKNPPSTDAEIVPVNERLEVCDSPTSADRLAAPLRLFTSCTESTWTNWWLWLVTVYPLPSQTGCAPAASGVATTRVVAVAPVTARAASVRRRRMMISSVRAVL